MPPGRKSRFDFAKPTAHITRAIVSRGRSRFEIIRPEPGLRAVISRTEVENLADVCRQRTGGLPLNSDAAKEFEAGMQFGSGT